MLIRAAMRASQRKLAVVLVLGGLAAAVAVHHSIPMDMHAMPGQSVCLAVLAAGALLTGVAVIVRATRPGPPPRVTNFRIPLSRPVACDWSTPARAGPLYLRLNVLRL